MSWVNGEMRICANSIWDFWLPFSVNWDLIAATLSAVLVLAILFTSPVFAVVEREATSGSAIEFIAENVTGDDISFSWTASLGSPAHSNERSFRWTAPVVNAPQDVIISLSLTSSGGCSKDYDLDVLVMPKATARISLDKDCIFSAPIRIGDHVLYIYNVTNTGNLPLYDPNLTDSQDWGPNCYPVYKSGDDGDGVLDPGESWWYEGAYTIADPADYPMLQIMQSNKSPEEIQQIISRLMELKSRLEIILKNVRQMSGQFDMSAASLEKKLEIIKGEEYTYFNYTNTVTGESLSRVSDSNGFLNKTVYADPISGAMMTVYYTPFGQISSEDLFFPPPGAREYLKIAYNSPSTGYRTITVTDYKSGDTLAIIVDMQGNILSKEYKMIPGYKPYEVKYFLKNTADVIAHTKDGNDVSDSDSFTLEVFRQLPILEIEKSADTNSPKAGDLLNYTISYKNVGAADAHQVVIKESYNKSVAFVRSDPSPDEGTTNQWSVGDLAAGESGKIWIETKIDADAEPGSEITNAVDISCQEGSNSRRIVNTTLVGTPLNITKIASANPIAPGSLLIYTIIYRNDGNTKQTNVTVYDWLDKYVNLVTVTSDPHVSSGSLGDCYWWNCGDLDPGESGTITIKVRVKQKNSFPENATSLVNNYKINSTQYEGQTKSLETYVIHSLWIYKTTDKSSYSEEENITYIIYYGNIHGLPARNVSITDVLPEVDLITAAPYPNTIVDHNLTWNIGTLKENENRTIKLIVQIPKKAKAKFHETSVVHGEGYVYSRKELSTVEEVKSLTNWVEIVGYYYGTYLYRASAYSTATLLGSAGTRILNREHGSGTYQETTRSSLDQENRSVSLDKELFANYHPAKSLLPGGRTIEHNSMWSDATHVENRILLDDIKEVYRYADTLNKSSSFQADMNQTVYNSKADFVSGKAEISYKKLSPETAAIIQEIDENYHGSFRVLESVDSYGESPKFSKSSTGKGFVSSDKMADGLQRSYESGSGYYSSEESSQLSSVYKISKMRYSPVQVRAGSSNISYADLWTEGMWTRDKDEGLFIGEKLQYAFSVDKETSMETSRLSLLGKFNGSLNILLKNKRSISLDETFTGSYQISTAVSLYSTLKHLFPHVNITKEAVMLDEEVVLFIINVTNDGNKLLKPLNVTDFLPEGCSYINSSIRAKVNGQMVNWTIPSLDIGRTLSIKMRAKVDGGRRFYTNVVKVRATCKGSIIVANNSTTFEAYYQPLPCCPGTEDMKTETMAFNATSIFNTTPTNGTWGDWSPSKDFNISGNITECACFSNAYYDDMEKSMKDICCSSNYEVP